MIGVYGGTFNPVHYGHLRTALEIRQILNLAQIRLVPCAQPAHREQPGVTVAMRLQMLNIAVGQCAKLLVDNREIKRDEPSYMVDTLQSIRAEVGEQSLVLIMGADAFNYLSSWYQWQHLFDFAHVLVMNRPGSYHHIKSDAKFLTARLIENRQDLCTAANGYLFFQEVTSLAISATRIREMFIAGHSPRFLLPDAVIDFIHTNQLYLADTINN